MNRKIKETCINRIWINEYLFARMTGIAISEDNLSIVYQMEDKTGKLVLFISMRTTTGNVKVEFYEPIHEQILEVHQAAGIFRDIYLYPIYSNLISIKNMN